MKNKSKNLNIIFSFISVGVSFIIVMIANCLSIKDGKFSIGTIGTKLVDPVFWIIVAASSLCMIMAYFAFYNYRRTKHLNSEEFDNKIKVYNERLKLKPSNFHEFIREDNLAEKTRVYKEKINEKISNLEYKYIKIPNEKLNKPKALKIRSKIDNLKSKITDEFIEKNILHMKVKYSELHAKNFRKDAYDRIEDDRKDFSNEKAILARSGVTKVLLNVGTTIMMNTLILSCALYLSFSPQFFLVILTTVCSMCMNAFLGSSLADRVFRNEIIIPLENKTIILENAVKWASNTPNKTFREIIQDFIEEKNNENVTKEESKNAEQTPTTQNT